jgi:hypothetical protein
MWTFEGRSFEPLNTLEMYGYHTGSGRRTFRECSWEVRAVPLIRFVFSLSLSLLDNRYRDYDQRETMLFIGTQFSNLYT